MQKISDHSYVLLIDEIRVCVWLFLKACLDRIKQGPWLRRFIYYDSKTNIKPVAVRVQWLQSLGVASIWILYVPSQKFMYVYVGVIL